jgi:hypothetical protein
MRCLSTELKDYLETVDISDSFSEFAALLQRLDNRKRALKANESA